MKKDLEITNEDRKLSQPLKPQNVPIRTKVPLPQFYQQSITEFKDALDIDPKSGFFFYLKMPAFIFFSTLAGYVVGRFGFSVTYIFFIGYTIYFIYKRKITKFKNSLKSLINFNTRREKAKYSGETVEWMNYIVQKFWTVAEPVISSDIYQNINRELLKVCPPFLNDLKLTEFTLGSRPPFIDRITYHSSKDDTVTLDVSLGFVPLEASKDAVDYFLGQKKSWNSKIVLAARLGTKNGIGINLPILVKEFYFVGRMRVILSLFPKNTFIKDVEICLMEVPDFDFTLVPLKTVDIMDIPGLSAWIKKIINTGLSSAVVNPNSIKINVDQLAQAKGFNIGVICLQVLTLENDEDEKLMADIDIDGNSKYQTTYRDGRNLVYNEYFYMIIQNVDEKIGLNFHGVSNSSRRRIGALFLRDVHLEPIEEDSPAQLNVDDKLVKINPQQKIKPRRTMFNKTRLVREEQTYAFINTNLQFYPIQKRKTNSAIVKLRLVGVEDMVGTQDTSGEIYSSYCSIIVSPLNKDKSSIPLDFIQNTSSAAALVVSGVLKTEEGVVSDINTGTSSTLQKLLPPSSSTFNVFESKRVFNSNSPNFNEVFEFFSRDLSVDVVSICIINDKNGEIIGRIGVSLSDVVDGKLVKYKLKDARKGRMEVSFSLDYVDLKDTEEEIVKYIGLQKITIDTVSEVGVFYGVIETNTDCYTMEPFTSSLPIKKSIYVPVHEDNTLKFKLYKETSNGDIFIGEENLETNLCEVPKKKALILNDQISVTLSLEGEDLKDYDGSIAEKECLKVIQLKFGKFYGLNEEVFVEFQRGEEIVRASSFSRDKTITSVFTILSGKEDLIAYIKNGDQGENRILGRCTIPERHVDERVLLNENGLSVDLKVDVQSCSYKPIPNLKKGFLEVYIKTARNLKTSEKGTVNPYIKILVNDNKVYKTKVVTNTINPVFNESFMIKIDKFREVITIQLYDEGSSSKNALLSFIEFPLHNINVGFSEIELKLTDAKTFRYNGSTLRIGFNFYKDARTLQIKKKGILSDFFGF